MEENKLIKNSLLSPVETTLSSKKNSQLQDDKTPEQNPKFYEMLISSKTGAPSANRFKKSCLPSAIVKTKVPTEQLVGETDFKRKNKTETSQEHDKKRKIENIGILCADKIKTELNHKLPSQSIVDSSRKEEDKFLPVHQSSSSKSVKKMSSKHIQQHTTKKDDQLNKVPIEDKKVTHYDPNEIKSYMELQRERKRAQLKKEQEDRKRAIEKRKQSLLELENKRRNVISKQTVTSKVSPKDLAAITGKFGHNVSLATKAYRERKSKISSASKVKSPGSHPTAPHPNSQTNKHTYRTAEDLISAEANLRSTALLNEFQNIVQRECNLLLMSKTVIDSKELDANHQNCLEKATATSFSISSSSVLSSLKDKDGKNEDTEQKRVINAVVKIQSLIRGYLVRKKYQFQRSMFNDRRFRRPTRRMSFYKPRPSVSLDEHTIGGTSKRKQPLSSPATSRYHYQSLLDAQDILEARKSTSCPKSAFGVTIDTSPYIPPPPQNTPNQFLSVQSKSYSGTSNLIFSPARAPSTLSSTSSPATSLINGGGTGRRSSLTRVDEPFPKEALKLLAAQNSHLIGNSSSPRNNTSCTAIDGNKQKESMSIHEKIRRNKSLPVVQVNNAEIPSFSNLFQSSEVPTFSMMLQQKVRPLDESNKEKSRLNEWKKCTEFDQTPTKRVFSTKSDKNDLYYDSDSTQHASVILTNSVVPEYNSNDDENTITDDYIGPNEEVMREAYLIDKVKTTSSDGSINNTIDAVSTSTSSSSKYIHHQKSETSSTDGSETRDKFILRRRAKRRKETFMVNEKHSSIDPHWDSLRKDLQLKVNEERESLLNHALAFSLQESEKNEAFLTTRETSSFNEVNQLGKKFDTINEQLQQLNEVIRTKVNSSETGPTAATFLELAKCQKESLKATVEIQKWVSELSSSSKERLIENKRRQTVDIATAVVVAVEEAKKLVQRRSNIDEKSVQELIKASFQNETAQTGKSLLVQEEIQNESDPTFSDQFLPSENIAQTTPPSKKEEVIEEIQSVSDGEKSSKLEGNGIEKYTDETAPQSEKEIIQLENSKADDLTAHGTEEDPELSQTSQNVDKASFEDVSHAEIDEENPNHISEEVLESEAKSAECTVEDAISDINVLTEVKEENDRSTSFLLSDKEKNEESIIASVHTETPQTAKSSLIQEQTQNEDDQTFSDEFLESENSTTHPKTQSNREDEESQQNQSVSDSEVEYSSKVTSPKEDFEKPADDALFQNELESIHSDVSSSPRSIVDEPKISDEASPPQNLPEAIGNNEVTFEEVFDIEEEDDLEMAGFLESQRKSDEEASEEAIADIESLDQHKKEIGWDKQLSNSREVYKWSRAPRDMVDSVLVQEMIKQNSSWTDLRKIETKIQKDLAESILSKSVKKVLHNISNQIKND